METGAKVLLICHVTGHICVHEKNIFNLLKEGKSINLEDRGQFDLIFHSYQRPFFGVWKKKVELRIKRGIWLIKLFFCLPVDLFFYLVRVKQSKLLG